MATYGSESFKIQTNLPQLPPDGLPKELYPEFQALHLAIFSLLRGISQYAGIDAPSSDIWSSLSYSDTILTGNATRMYVVAGVTIARGQAVNLYLSGGILKVRLADADSATTMMHGVANSAGSAGDIIEINWLRGLLDSVGGMTTGTLYYLSTTAGAVQSARPSGAGQIIQAAGVALNATTLLFDCSLNYIQL